MSSEAESLPLAAPAAHAAAGEARNPFRVRGYVTWLIASVLAGTGVGIQAVTVPLFVRDRVSDDHRALAIAAVLVCQNAPAALFALVGGVVADRVERRRILVRTYGVAALVSVQVKYSAAPDERHSPTMAAALRLSAEVENATIVSIVCDRGDRYLSTGVFPA